MVKPNYIIIHALKLLNKTNSKKLSNFIICVSYLYLQQYLVKYGYIEEGPLAVNHKDSGSSVQEAIKDFQKFSGLPVTGKILYSSKENAFREY